MEALHRVRFVGLGACMPAYNPAAAAGTPLLTRQHAAHAQRRRLRRVSAYRGRFIGREVEVLAEPGSESRLSGYTDRYVRITFAGPAGLVDSAVRVKATGEEGPGLAGEIAR